MEECSKPTILVTNDDGMDAPGLRALVQVLVATNRYNVQVAAPDSVYSGTVAGAREAFFNDIPSIAISYDWVKGKSDPRDFSLAAQECLPIISAVLVDIKNLRYRQRCFLNIDVPTHVASHKGKSFINLGWTQATSETEGRKMTSAMTMDIDAAAPTETDSSCVSPEHLIFKREVKSAQFDPDDNDYKFLQEGYITVTPLAALSNAEVDCHAYFKDWLQNISELPSSTAL